MKCIWIRNSLIAALFFAGTALMAQNQVPEITNLSLTNNIAQQRIEVTFDVSDAESDFLDLNLTVSDDNGVSFLFSGGSISGDNGFPKTPGTGKVIYWNYPSTVTSFSNFQLRVVADDREPVDIPALLQLVDSNRLRQRLSFIQDVRHRSANPAHLEAVKDSIEATFEHNDWQSSRQPFAFGTYTGQNILGRKAGLYEEAKTYVLDGHFDGVANSPAADDNGSAVTALMEAAEVLKDYPFGRSVRLIGFDLEETGLNGSANYVSSGIESWENIEGVINLEMIGYFSQAPNSHQLPTGFNLLFPTAYSQIAGDNFRGNFIANVANVASNDLKANFDSCANALVPNLRVISIAVTGTGTSAPDLRRSDHASFWDAGIPALMLTDGANFRNPNYHSPADTLGNLNFTFMRQVTQAAIATLVKLADVRHAAVEVIAIDPATGSTELANQQEPRFSIYPNPTDSEVILELNQVNSGLVKVTVYNLQGKVVKSMTLNHMKLRHRISLQGLSVGAYSFGVTIGEEFSSSILIVQP